MTRAILIGLLLVPSHFGCRRAAETDPSPRTVTVFAAASLTDALEALADSFETAHPAYDIVVNVAATSLLARQIEQGAPADLFFSASPDWMTYLADRGRVRGRPVGLLTNRLVAAGPADGTPVTAPADLLRLDRVALADPEHVPAGIYAREALACLGLWEAVRPHVIPMLDVRAALLAVRNGAAETAIVYASDVRATPNVQVYFEWPPRCHPDIRYAAARLRDAPEPEGARRFFAFAIAPARGALWERFGFQLR